MTYPVIMDVDTGIDDAMAIMFAVRHPDIDLRAISCVAGNAAVDQVLANTLRILDVVKAPDIPVAAGATRPLIEKPRDASYVHGSDGLANLPLPTSRRTPYRGHAVELLKEQITRSSEPVTIVALAPMTNLALLLRTYPEVATNIARILFMGGSATIGNATAVAEFNIWHDPEAARIVLEGGVPLTMYGLDVFNHVAVDEATVAHLAASEDNVAKVLGGLLGHLIPDPDGGDHAYRLSGDAGAVCALVAPELATIETHPVAVELAPGNSRGQTIVDRRHYIGEDSIHPEGKKPWPVADVVLEVDAEQFVQLFLRTLGVLTPVDAG